ncbi:gibberellin-regulated protein 4-like [Phalaenopsis equestris]|uniref:gibberellin-regulated protein 4-like n=1 Tax=Phalaenopsis equestris TaxID=78828 RepID=UPI0009E59CB5|nr:gibberellin-regulated protein 4-like [Phalaenopsis equestris]XP_020594541.1 gibberellin-regulated protein 4-like [Phalaenopsis equestris]
MLPFLTFCLQFKNLIKNMSSPLFQYFLSVASYHLSTLHSTLPLSSAMPKLLYLLLLLSFLILSSSSMNSLEEELQHQLYKRKPRFGPGSIRTYQCPRECGRRCSKTQYHKACILFCGKCCRKCLCVPPGFYGNKQVCPCYNNWKTKRGGPKCP